MQTRENRGTVSARDTPSTAYLVGMTVARLLDMRAIADRLGVKEKSVRHYHAMAERRRREDNPKPGDMPPPDDRFGRTPVWKASTIRRWEAARPGRGVGGGPRARRREAEEESA